MSSINIIKKRYYPRLGYILITMPPACLNTFASSIKQIYLRFELGYKILFLVTLAMFALVTYIPSLHYQLISHVAKIVQGKQYWRLFTSFLANGGLAFFNSIYMLLCLYFLNHSLRELESKYSTVYVLFEIVKQTFIFNLIITVVAYPLIVFSLFSADYFSPAGLFLLTVNFSWQSAARNSESHFKLPVLPCYFKKKYLPWFTLIALMGLVNFELFSLGMIFVISMTQHLCLKKPLFALPVGFYRAINRCLPRAVKNIHGYINVESVKDNLLEVCQPWGKEEELGKTQQLPEIATQQPNFKKYWSEKEVSNTVQHDTNKNSIQSQPQEGNNNTLNLREDINQHNQQQGQQEPEEQSYQQLGESNCSIISQNPIEEQKSMSQSSKTYQEHWRSIEISQSQQIPQISGEQIRTNTAAVSNRNAEEQQLPPQCQHLNQGSSNQQQIKSEPAQKYQPSKPLQQNPPSGQQKVQVATKAASAFDEQQNWY